ncbi:hypothetical protein GCT13_07355 [Paraburkholderia sp. CNPSo 3157]|uniref:Uncharacterized protein n=1 Tax=Paraburkholderia franconis TaxID=2654983 RepID=A0A7X1N7E4_9BURK|nr:hypothetical protein [Paraburkholderia franconis]MPW16757.1 hypothetical protein [Paraburkholderia franconis]
MDHAQKPKRDDQSKTGTTTEPGEPTETMKSTTPQRSNPHPRQTAEVPLGTGDRPEPPGGGGRPSHRRASTNRRDE